MIAALPWGRFIVGTLAIGLIFGLFALAFVAARRSHTRRVGGIHWLEVLRGRWPRVRRRK